MLCYEVRGRPLIALVYYLLVLEGEWRSEYRCSLRGVYRGLYRDCHRDPLPHSPISTSRISLEKTPRSTLSSKADLKPQAPTRFSLGFRVQGLGFRVYGLGFKVSSMKL